MTEFFSNINNPLLLSPGQAIELRFKESSCERVYSSRNSYVVSALQTGKIIGNRTGFTDVQITENGKKIANIFFEVTPGESSLPILFNRYNRIAQPADKLVLLDNELTSDKKPIYICEQLVEPFLRMQKAAEAEGLILHASQGYRSLSEQFAILEKYTQRDGYDAAIKRCAPPGYSEHHTGLAMDLCGGRTENNKFIPDNEKIYGWIADNCYKFGFMIKNLPGKEGITGTISEPWHVRYVGDLEIARELHEGKLSMDEYADTKSVSVACLELDEIINYSEKQRKMMNMPAGESSGQEDFSKADSSEKEAEKPAVSERKKNNVKKLKIAVIGSLILPGDGLPECDEVSRYLENFKTLYGNADISLAGAAMDKVPGYVDRDARELLKKAASGSSKPFYFLPEGLPSAENDESSNADSIIVNIKGIRMGIVNFTLAETELYSYDAADISSNILEEEITKLEEKISSLKKNGADFVLTYIHWGDRFPQEVSAIQKYISVYAGHSGADIILGSGPWNVQQYRSFKMPSQDGYRETHCFYGIGNAVPIGKVYENFVGSDGIIAEFVVNYDAEKACVTNIEADWKPAYKVNYKSELKLFSPEAEPKASEQLKKELKKSVNNNKPEAVYPHILNMSDRQVMKISGEVFPEDEYESFFSSNAAVASVTNKGFLVANGIGYAGITAEKKDGSKLSCIVKSEYTGNKLPVLVNGKNYIPDAYVPEKLVGGLEYFLPNNVSVTIETAEAWKKMRDDAREIGILLHCVGGYRSSRQQQKHIANYALKYGVAAAEKRYMPVGCSEHHLGTALDISGMKTITEITSTSDAIQWVWENAYRYGFIARRSNIDVSKLAYVHVRYVPGVKLKEETLTAAQLLDELI